MGFIHELKRRNVFRVGMAYMVLGWVVIQVTDTVAPALAMPEWTLTVVTWFGVIGFPFALLLAWAFELTPDGIRREDGVDRAQTGTDVTGRKLDLVIIGLLAVALGFVIWDSYLNEPKPGAVVAEVADKTIDSAPGSDISASIAVLPFVNMSADKDQEYFSDGISEELLNLLAQVPGLKVAGRSSSFAFKGKDTDLREIGAVLNVGTLLEGSVRKSGTTLRITAQLIDAADGFHLWSDTYDRELTDVFAIQDEIARAILVQLKSRLLHDEEVVLASTATGSEVYDLYLRARQHIYARKRRSLEAAVALLDLAIEKDPQYAPAYAQRGIAHLLLWTAFAYQSIGNDERFNDAMARFRAANDLLQRQGMASSHWFEFNDALYYAMLGDQDRAIAHLDAAVNKGHILGGLKLADSAPPLKPLEGDPRYEAIQARMIENLNRQRAALGLGPAQI